ncbi:MAG TPA: cytochrome c3 family protein [Kofleriaceae bacterium]
MKLLVAGFAMLCACMQSHAPGVQALTGEDCYTCHRPEYESAPDHAARSTACSNCHRNSAWQPALADHPEVAFPIAAGAHATARCLVCHDLDSPLPSTLGENTNCIQCHPNSSGQQRNHVGATSMQGAAYAYQDAVPNFCLSCHPKGQAAKHPDTRFPRTDHHAVPCLSCHFRSNGPDTAGMNTSCVESGCHHTLSWSDGQHGDVNSYASVRGDGSNKHFCLASGCHPDGRNR